MTVMSSLRVDGDNCGGKRPTLGSSMDLVFRNAFSFSALAGLVFLDLCGGLSDSGLFGFGIVGYAVLGIWCTIHHLC